MKIVTAVSTRDGRVNWKLERWLQEREIDYYKNVGFSHGPTIAYNTAVQRFLGEDAEATHLALLDDDVVPDDSMLNLWREPGDLIYCGAPGRSSPGHFGDGSLWAGCMRASRWLLGRMRELRSPPWFDWPVNELHTQRTKCPCLYFWDGARMAGCESRMVGRVWHAIHAEAGFDEKGNIILRRSSRAPGT